MFQNSFKYLYKTVYLSVASPYCRKTSCQVRCWGWWCLLLWCACGCHILYTRWWWRLIIYNINIIIYVIVSKSVHSINKIRNRSVNIFFSHLLISFLNHLSHVSTMNDIMKSWTAEVSCKGKHGNWRRKLLTYPLFAWRRLADGCIGKIILIHIYITLFP